MKLNYDCLRDILLYCEDKMVFTNDPRNNRVIQPVGIDRILNNLSYSKDDIRYSILKLEEAEYIHIKHRNPNNDYSTIQSGSIDIITHKGHQYLESVREQSVWEKVKSVAENTGNHTLEFLKLVAHDIAVESAKAYITTHL